MAFKLFSQDSTSFPQEKKQQFLIIILIIVTLVVLFVLYFGFLRSSQSEMIEESATSSLLLPSVGRGILVEDITKRINFDIDFLKEPYFQALKIHGEWPLQIEGQGRDNPFLSF